MKYSIHVPATTANLGPGFDCLGLTLDLWNDVEVSTESSGFSIEIHGLGKDLLPVDGSNSIFAAMQKFSGVVNQKLPENLKLICTNRIPLGSGLGSSSAAAVAGLLAASAIIGVPLSSHELIEIATEIEGHPDNVAPCILGGLTASMMGNGKVITQKIEIGNFDLVLIHPFYPFPTSVARSIIPQSIPHHDAVFNASHAIMTVEALRSGDLRLLKSAMQDRLHQPYRIPLISGAEEAIAASISAGAIATVLSGAGPSLLSFSPSPSKSQAIADAMQTAFQAHGQESEVYFPLISANGASVHRIE